MMAAHPDKSPARSRGIRVLWIIAACALLATIVYFLQQGDTVFDGRSAVEPAANAPQRPNFLLIISDDQSWEHTSFANYPLVSTPNFDRIAREGVYFENSYAAAPTCTASRSAILAGQPTWRLGSASLLHGAYSRHMISYQAILKEAGYSVGYSGKGWGPGPVPGGLGLDYPPAGVQFNKIRQDLGSHLGSLDLAANFEAFLNKSPAGLPFSFWAGSSEPHRPYKVLSNRFLNVEDARLVPAFLPNTRAVQGQLSAYLDEVEVFDRDVGRLLAILQERKLLDSTVVIVTSDNGMPFSRAKANNYLHGVRVPMAVRWGGITEPGRVVKDFVNLADIAPTLLELAGITIPKAMTASSIAYSLSSGKSGLINADRTRTYTAFERHAGFIRGGQENLTYPRRAIHTENFLYIKNHFPNRWPAGDPPRYHEAYPFLLVDTSTKSPLDPYHSLATQKRPAEELYDLRTDPYQLNNVADQEEYLSEKLELRNSLNQELVKTKDPLELTGKDEFQAYGYFGP